MIDTKAVRVDPKNAEQLKAWDGDEGSYWARHAEQFDRAMGGYHGRFLDAAAIQPGDRVLDIGCGTGQTTRDAARLASSGSALGVDLSSQMIEVARELAVREGVANARFGQVDAAVHPFGDDTYDVAISRTGAMFFGDPAAGFTNVASSLRPGGRLALLVWQELSRNEWLVAFVTALAGGRDLPGPPPDAPGPFSMSDPERVRQVLGSAGFGQPRFEGLREPMYFGSSADDAYEFVLGLSGWMLEGLDADGRARALGDLRASIAMHETVDGVTYDSATWIITAERAASLA